LKDKGLSAPAFGKLMKKATIVTNAAFEVCQDPSLTEKIGLVLSEIDLVVQKFRASQKRRVRHLLIGFGDLYLLLVLMNFFEAVGMGCELLQFVMKFLFQGDVDLICPFGDDGDGLVQIACFPLDRRNILGFHHIAQAVTDLSA